MTKSLSTDTQPKTMMEAYSESHNPNVQASFDSKEIVNGIFDSLMAICTGWRTYLKSNDELNHTKKEWMAAFIDHGVSDMGAINYALKKVRDGRNPFFPHVMDFIDLCRDAVLLDGIKNVEESYKEISDFCSLYKGQVSKLSAATYHTYVSLQDPYNWKMMNHRDHKIYWEQEHTETLNLVRSGGELKRCRQSQDQKQIEGEQANTMGRSGTIHKKAKLSKEQAAENEKTGRAALSDLMKSLKGRRA